MIGNNSTLNKVTKHSLEDYINSKIEVIYNLREEISAQSNINNQYTHKKGKFVNQAQFKKSNKFSSKRDIIIENSLNLININQTVKQREGVNKNKSRRTVKFKSISSPIKRKDNSIHYKHSVYKIDKYAISSVEKDKHKNLNISISQIEKKRNSLNPILILKNNEDDPFNVDNQTTTSRKDNKQVKDDFAVINNKIYDIESYQLNQSKKNIINVSTKSLSKKLNKSSSPTILNDKLTNLIKERILLNNLIEDNYNKEKEKYLIKYSNSIDKMNKHLENRPLFFTQIEKNKLIEEKFIDKDLLNIYYKSIDLVEKMKVEEDIFKFELNKIKQQKTKINNNDSDIVIKIDKISNSLNETELRRKNLRVNIIQKLHPDVAFINGPYISNTLRYNFENDQEVYDIYKNKDLFNKKKQLRTEVINDYNRGVDKFFKSKSKKIEKLLHTVAVNKEGNLHIADKIINSNRKIIFNDQVSKQKSRSLILNSSLPTIIENKTKNSFISNGNSINNIDLRYNRLKKSDLS